MTTIEKFAQRIVGAVDSASLAILLSIGHQTRLFDSMADLQPSTSAQIADAAGLHERYVREWLGGMVAAEVIVFDPAASTYFLPPDHAAVLTRAAGPDNLACVAQFIAMLGEVEQKILGCFHNGGGLPYSDYPRFHQLMAEQADSGSTPNSSTSSCRSSTGWWKSCARAPTSPISVAAVVMPST